MRVKFDSTFGPALKKAVAERAAEEKREAEVRAKAKEDEAKVKEEVDKAKEEAEQAKEAKPDDNAGKEELKEELKAATGEEAAATETT